MLNVPGKTLWNKKNVTAEECAEACSSDTNCLSFEITKTSGKCYLSEATAASNKKIKRAKSRDYYQLVDRNYSSLFLFISFYAICNPLMLYSL